MFYLFSVDACVIKRNPDTVRITIKLLNATVTICCQLYPLIAGNLLNDCRGGGGGETVTD